MNFAGIVDIYLEDLQTNDTIHFGYQNGSTLPVEPDIAFSAESTIKIPIMISIYRRVDEPTPQNILDQISLMIEQSGNDPADTLMEAVMSQGYRAARDHPGYANVGPAEYLPGCLHGKTHIPAKG